MTQRGARAKSTVRSFIKALRELAAGPQMGGPEDQLKPLVKTLFEGLGDGIQARTEVSAKRAGRPDVGILAGGALIGYVELKAPDRAIDPERFSDHDLEQWRRFKNLPNLIYSNGAQWRLYRTGELAAIVDLTPAIRTGKGRKAAADEVEKDFLALLQPFLAWAPISPRTPQELAQRLAPLTRLLRQEVRDALGAGDAAVTRVYEEWRSYLFPDADFDQFADAFAQTFVYAMLLARAEGLETPAATSAVAALRPGHALLATTLDLMNTAREAIDLAASALERQIGAVDFELIKGTGDPWLYFYEDFLAAYDPELRKERGVYYTPVEVVHAQVILVDELLRTRFQRPLSYADEDVLVLDPAVGTGTYLLGVLDAGIRAVESTLGPGHVPDGATSMAKRLHGFEILIGPYAVAHQRLERAIKSYGGQAREVRIYLTDTLESPYADPAVAAQQMLSILVAPLTTEHRIAMKVKRETPILVCIGNPPYDREAYDPNDPQALERRRKGGWVRFGHHSDASHPDEAGAILQDFLRPVREAGGGVHLKSLYNDYVYFWRWALWKVFEQGKDRGIVTFITAASYLTGPGFAGMREVMRRTLDELWIIDLGGDSRGPRPEENVFAIRVPVAIAIAARYGQPRPDEPAQVHYTRIRGTQEEKLAALRAIRSFADLAWHDAPDGWREPFVPPAKGEYAFWPPLTDIFPWQHSGVEMKRTWPIGETRDLLLTRWRALASETDPDNRRRLFRPSRDRDIFRSYTFRGHPELNRSPLSQLDKDSECPCVVRYGYRSFDRQWILFDPRLGDFMRPELWEVCGPKQVYMTSLLTSELGKGPAATATPYVPDRHHFRGSYGAKDVIPLWRDAQATEPNVARGVLAAVQDAHGRPIRPEDLFAYAYAVLFCPGYVDRFFEELRQPGPRLPITKDPDLFDAAAAVGRRLLWLHTWGERFTDEFGPTLPVGAAKHQTAGGEKGCLHEVRYDPQTQVVWADGDVFGPVPPEIWEFSISGYKPVQEWLERRKCRPPRRRRSSALDDIRPDWDAPMREEFLQVLWVLEATMAELPKAEELLDEILASPLFMADELPKPDKDERGPLKPVPLGI